MRLRRAADRLAASRAGRYAFMGGLQSVARVVVGGAKVGKAVVVALDDVVDRVGAWAATQMARVAVDLEDEGPHDGVPAGREPSATVVVLPASRGHDGLLPDAVTANKIANALNDHWGLVPLSLRYAIATRRSGGPCG